MALTYSAGRADLIDYSNGFPNNPPDLTFNGTARARTSYAELTHLGDTLQAGSVFSNFRCNITSFSTTFTFRLGAAGSGPPYMGGITFTIQGNSPTALGPANGGLGYGSVDAIRWPCINHSVAIKFDLWNDEGEGDNSTGLFTNGHYPTIGVTPPDVSIDLRGTDINQLFGHVFQVDLDYDGTTLVETITDLASGRFFTCSYTIDIPAFVGDDTAYVGFTGATGFLDPDTQQIRTWRFESPDGQGSACPAEPGPGIGFP
jgi:hypothetical protein